MGYSVWPQITGSRKNLSMPSQWLMCLEVAISQQIRLWEGKSASDQPCKSFNASPDCCGQARWVSMALWEKVDVKTTGTILEHVCRLSWPKPAKARSERCRRSIGEGRNGLLPFDHTAVKGCWMLPRSLGSHHQGMFCWRPQLTCWQLRSPTYRLGWETSGWPLVWIASVEACRR